MSGIEIDPDEHQAMRDLRDSDFPYYVSMDDRFFSGEGYVRNRIAKYVYGARDLVEAQIVADNARSRSEQKNIKIWSKKPFFDPLRYRVSFFMPNHKGYWYTRNAWSDHP